MAFIRVRDPETKHEFDVPEVSPLLRKGLVKRVKADRYPPSTRVRRPKHHLNLAGRSAAQESAPETSEATATDIEEI